VNLFVAGQGASLVDVERPRRALTDLLRQLPFLSPDAMKTWCAPSGHAVLLSVSSGPGKAGGVSYSSFDQARAALFSGRPIRWRSQGRADGRLAIDVESYHSASGEWAGELDGRCTVVRADDECMELYTDPLGAYPVFEARTPGVRWFSNNPDALRLLCRDDSVDELALASVLAGGWSLGGQPIWRAVRRVERGIVLKLDSNGTEQRKRLLPVDRIIEMSGAALDPGAAAEQLVQLVSALADWPGRPNVVPVTGGRDSRLILAAALRAKIDFDARTGGAAGEPDVEVASRLCAIAGIPHALLAPDPHGDRFSRIREAARITLLASGGTATLADAAGFPLGVRDGPLPLWHSGQGGEVARGYYRVGGGRVADCLYARFAGRRPGRPGIVSREGTQLLRAQIASFVQELRDSGAKVEDVPDFFYLLERMGSWAAASHGVVELVRDTTSPLWSARLLPHLLAQSARERKLEKFHLLVLRELAPTLVGQRFQDGSTWPETQRPLQRRLGRGRKLGGKVAAEIHVRAAQRVRASRALVGERNPGASDSGHGLTASVIAPADPFDAVLAVVREVVMSQPQHIAWSVLDRPRVERILTSRAATLDEMTRYYVWRLASAFLGID
jgi:hypothetical protein